MNGTANRLETILTERVAAAMIEENRIDDQHLPEGVLSDTQRITEGLIIHINDLIRINEGAGKRSVSMSIVEAKAVVRALEGNNDQ